VTDSEIPCDVGGHRTVNHPLVREFRRNVGLWLQILGKTFEGRNISMEDAVSDVTGRIVCSKL